MAEAPSHAPSLARRVVVACVFGLCLIAVSGLLGFEVMSLVRGSASTAAPTATR